MGTDIRSLPENAPAPGSALLGRMNHPRAQARVPELTHGSTTAYGSRQWRQTRAPFLRLRRSGRPRRVRSRPIFHDDHRFVVAAHRLFDCFAIGGELRDQGCRRATTEGKKQSIEAPGESFANGDLLSLRDAPGTVLDARITLFCQVSPSSSSSKQLHHLVSVPFTTRRRSSELENSCGLRLK